MMSTQAIVAVSDVADESLDDGDYARDDDSGGLNEQGCKPDEEAWALRRQEPPVVLHQEASPCVHTVATCNNCPTTFPSNNRPHRHLREHCESGPPHSDDHSGHEHNYTSNAEGTESPYPTPNHLEYNNSYTDSYEDSIGHSNGCKGDNHVGEQSSNDSHQDHHRVDNAHRGDFVRGDRVSSGSEVPEKDEHCGQALVPPTPKNACFINRHLHDDPKHRYDELEHYGDASDSASEAHGQQARND